MKEGKEWALTLYDIHNINEIKSIHIKVEDYFKNKFIDVSFSWMDNIIIIATKYIVDKTLTLNIIPCKIERKANQTKAFLWNKDKFITNYKGSDYIPSTNGIHMLLVNFDSNFLIPNF
jgi:hypothetical protein